MNLPVRYIAITPHTLARILTRKDANIIYLLYIIDGFQFESDWETITGLYRPTNEGSVQASHERRLDGILSLPPSYWHRQ